jgi:hypothetical protein
MEGTLLPPVSTTYVARDTSVLGGIIAVDVLLETQSVSIIFSSNPPFQELV